MVKANLSNGIKVYISKDYVLSTPSVGIFQLLLDTGCDIDTLSCEFCED